MSEEHESFPNGVEAALLLVVLFAIEIFVATVVLSFDTFANVNRMDLSGLISIAANGLLFSVLLPYKRLSYRTLFHASRHSIAATFVLLSLPILLLVPGLVIVAGTLNAFVVALVPMTSERAAWFAEMNAYSALAIFFGCIVAPVLEEMLFRGVILRSFLQQYSRTAAILGSAALFALAHLNVYQLASAFAIGVVAGWLYERTRSLWPCVLLHASYNGFVTYAYARFSTSDTQQDFTASFYFVAFLLAILAGLWLLRMLMPARASTRSL